MLSIDGSYGEGGGQIVRSAVALSAITGTPIQVRNVRARRAKPGLQPQHLVAVKAAAELCGAELEGAELQSVHFTFEPKHSATSGEYRFDIGTAGSAPLVVQTVLLPLALASGGSEVEVIGGTHNPHAPSSDYLERVYFPVLESTGLRATFSCSKPGFYPRGGGELKLKVQGQTRFSPLRLPAREDSVRIWAHVVSGSLPPHVAERGAARIKERLQYQNLSAALSKREEATNGAGAAVLIHTSGREYAAGFTGLGERGKPIEEVSDEAYKAFIDWYASGTAVDEHLSDQLVLPMCVASEPSTWTTTRCTDHLLSVLWLAKQFLEIEYEVEETEQLCTVHLHPPRT